MVDHHDDWDMEVDELRAVSGLIAIGALCDSPRPNVYIPRKLTRLVKNLMYRYIHVIVPELVHNEVPRK